MGYGCAGETPVSELDRPQVSPLVLTLPEPPSANRWWRSARGRVFLSHEARDYKQDAFLRAGIKDKTLFPTEPISVIVVWHRNDKRGDLDKRLGVVLDALQSIFKRVPDPKPGKPKNKKWVLLAPGVYDDDDQIVQLWARRCDEHKDIPKGSVRIEIAPCVETATP